MVAKKRSSKRQCSSMRNKIEKKIREHHRKERKVAKKTPRRNLKSRKDPGIPNSAPFKEQMLKDIEQFKLAALAKKKNATVKKGVVKKNDGVAAKSEPLKLVEMLQSASNRSDAFAHDLPAEEESFGSDPKIKDNSKKAFFKDFKRVVEMADVVIQVLDARDPLGCRNAKAEKFILQQNKKMILLLNKTDLVPKSNVDDWLRFLKNEFPTIPFKASTQSQRTHLKVEMHAPPKHGGEATGSECVGAEGVLNILKNYCRDQRLKTSITVGVVGVPNVGKSSFINSLKRSRVCNVGSQPGVTRALQEIILDKNIKLIDCPGIVFAEDGADEGVLLRNVLRPDQLSNPAEAIAVIVQRVGVHELARIYGMEDFASIDDFLFVVAKTLGKVKKGAVPDVEAAAIAVLHDWNSGKIPYFSQPPVRTENVDACIVDSLASEFTLADAAKNEMEVCV